MTRRRKSYSERRFELISAASIINRAILAFENEHDLSVLRIIASQLRALIVYESTSRSLRHPLLLELAAEISYPLIVYTFPKELEDAFTQTIGQYPVEFFSTGDSLSLEKKPPYSVETTLQSAIEILHVRVGNEDFSIKQIIRMVADTEATHYDPTSPEILDELGTIRIGGLPPHYRTIFTTGKIVRDLCSRIIAATE